MGACCSLGVGVEFVDLAEDAVLDRLEEERVVSEVLTGQVLSTGLGAVCVLASLTGFADLAEHARVPPDHHARSYLFVDVCNGDDVLDDACLEVRVPGFVDLEFRVWLLGGFDFLLPVGLHHEDLEAR